MKTTFLWGTGLTLGVVLLSAQGNFMSAQETKQLKEVSPTMVETVDETTTDQTTESTTDQMAAPTANAEEGTTGAAGTTAPETDANVQSYSIVTENRVGPDGKRIQRKKVWKNGVLVEDKEEASDAADDEANLSAEIDGQLLPGTVSRLERNGNAPFDAFGNGMEANMSEMMKRMEENFRNQRARQAELMRQFGAGVGFPNRAVNPIPLSEYWIGASVTPVSPELAQQLNLPEGEGLLIREIVPGSPAEKAGLARFDILMKIQDEAVNDIAQIGKLVDQAKETPLSVEILRKGESQKLELTPEKRPDPNANSPLSSSLSEATSDEDSSEPVPVQREQIRVVRPGMIVPSEEAPVTTENAEENLPAAPQAEGK